jgi:S1-C subfamily serine protease
MKARVPILAALALAAHLTNLHQEASVRTLDEPVAVHGSGRIVIDGATSLRLRIRGAAPGTVLRITGANGDVESFQVESGDEWGPTMKGDEVMIETDAPIAITQVAAGSAAIATNATSCLVEVACSSAAESAEVREAGRAVAMIRFVRGEASYVCSGALLNDAANSGTPYFLTAHHCISTPEEAASIEAVWDDRSASCGISAAGNTTTRTYGAELLVSSAATDVALLRLRRLPPNRTFLGVSLEPLADGASVYRLSHADGAPQTFSSGVVHATGGECGAAPRGRFVYTSMLDGSVTTGSSGAPLLLPGLRVAGQLLGVCGAAPNDACASGNDAVDGSIAASWPLLAPFLDPPAAPRRRAVR